MPNPAQATASYDANGCAGVCEDVNFKREAEVIGNVFNSNGLRAPFGYPVQLRFCGVETHSALRGRPVSHTVATTHNDAAAG